MALIDPSRAAVLLHFGGAGTYTAATIVAGVFLALFALSFFWGGRPRGARVFSKRWAWQWLRASFPRLVVAGAFSGALFAASSLAGGGQAATMAERACQQPAAPFTTQAVTAERLAHAVAGLQRLAAAAAAGDRDGAPSLFFGTDTHNVTHDIDGPLRRVDPALGKEVCRSMVVLELQLAGRGDLAVVKEEATRSAELLERAGQEMGLKP